MLYSPRSKLATMASHRKRLLLMPRKNFLRQNSRTRHLRFGLPLTKLYILTFNLRTFPFQGELSCLLKMVKKFRYYLGWKKFLIRTDHRPLLQIRSFQAPSFFEARLFNTLSTYDFDIEYREVSWGKSTIIAGKKNDRGKKCTTESII